MAIKIITPDEDEIPEDLMIEIALLKQCSHENIVKYFGGYRKGDEIFVFYFFLKNSRKGMGEFSQFFFFFLVHVKDCNGIVRLQCS